MEISVVRTFLEAKTASAKALRRECGEFEKNRQARLVGVE